MSTHLPLEEATREAGASKISRALARLLPLTTIRGLARSWRLLNHNLQECKNFAKLRSQVSDGHMKIRIYDCGYAYNSLLTLVGCDLFSY